jgi:hypothetical protein
MQGRNYSEHCYSIFHFNIADNDSTLNTIGANIYYCYDNRIIGCANYKIFPMSFIVTALIILSVCLLACLSYAAWKPHLL